MDTTCCLLSSSPGLTLTHSQAVHLWGWVCLPLGSPGRVGSGIGGRGSPTILGEGIKPSNCCTCFLPEPPECWQQTLALLSCFPCGQLMATPGHARLGALSVAGQLGSALGTDHVCWVLMAHILKKKKNKAPSHPIHSSREKLCEGLHLCLHRKL